MWSLQICTGIIALLLCVLDKPVTGSHFRFATISCRPGPNNPLEMICEWRAAWRLNAGPCGNPCTQANVGQLSSSYYGYWLCTSGCGYTRYLAQHRYYVTGVDTADYWQQGRNDFSSILPGPGVFQIRYSGCCWVSLANGGGNYVIITEYNAGIRSDTGTPNSSPITTSNPLVNMDVSCGYRFDIPYADPDGDIVRCRWAVAPECGGICTPLPGATLYPNCTLIIPASARPLYSYSLYGVAIMLEDFPTTSILQGGVPKDGSTPLSKVPLQYIARIKDGCDCNNRPTFTTSSETTDVGLGQTYTKDIVASSPYGINAINVLPPTGANVGAMVTVNGSTASVTITWTPTSAGETLLCYQANDGNGCPGGYQCDTLRVSDPVDGEWCPYEEWGDCSVTCETGTETRSRVCECPEPAFGGSECEGSSTETRTCTGPCCPVDGGWCPYEEWGDCSVTCENGTQTRSRACECPATECGGYDCEGSSTETRTCTGPCCPVDGYLSDWLPWSPCSATCGLPGTVTRWRTKECIYPDPDCPGEDCGELPVEYENCTQQPCCLMMNEWESTPSFQHESGNRLHDIEVDFTGANIYDKYVTFRCGIVLIESIQNYDETYVAAVQAAVTEECVDYLSPVCHVTIPAPYGYPSGVMINYTCCDALY